MTPPDFKLMNTLQQLLTDHLDIWTAADTVKKSGRGRSSGNAASVYGIKKLRELILELAVRGKLVPQDANDEPASELLGRIQGEKVRLIAEGKIKSKSPSIPLLQRGKTTASVPHFEKGGLGGISEDEMPYLLPQMWEWVRLGTVVEVLDGLRKPVTKQDREPGPYPYYGASGVVDYVSNFIFDEPLVLVGEDGAKWGRGENTAFLIAGKTWVNNHAHVIRPYRSAIIDDYVARTLNAMDLGSFITGMTVPKLNQARLVSIVLPLPPLAEQHRIIAKVDELMALCDQLENQHNNAAEAHEKLVSHLLGTLTTSVVRPTSSAPIRSFVPVHPEPSRRAHDSARTESFAENWQRIAAHFDTLFTTETSIDALKQTLLQLAVMGKLVPQDPNDEPASELLKRIQAEKAKLIAEGKIKKGKPLAAIAEDEKPFELPKRWEWVRLADLLALVTDGDHQAPPKAESGVPFLVIGNLNTGNVLLEGCRFVPAEYYEKLDWGKKPNRNDLLYTVTGSYGIPIKVNISDKFCVQRHVAILKTVESTPINYLTFLLKSKYALQYATEIATGIAQKTVPLTGLRIMPIASPPEAEQQRIVAKVDELMALCDQLKSRITQAKQLQQKLADVVVEQAIA